MQPRYLTLLLIASLAFFACGPGGGSGSGSGDGDAVTTDSGLRISEIRAGGGPSPKATDVVVVHYHGTFEDGRVFDSSVDRGAKATFPLNRVIACWTEGLQLMKVGGKSRLVCPPEIAYGAMGSPPKIPANSTLVFEVELFEIR